MKKIFIFGIIILLAIVIIGFYIYPKISGNAVANMQAGVTVLQRVTNDNLPAYLEATEFVKALPKDAVIGLKLYNFNTGNRQLEDSYVIKKNEVEKGIADKPDLIISIHSKYLSQLSSGFCQTVSKANSNGDLGIELGISKTSFLWKYRWMNKYKSCFGL